MQTARERLARHDVIAPFAGVISRKLTEAGEWVETGVPVADLVGTAELWLDVQAPGESIEIVSKFDPLRPVVVRGNEVLTQNQAVRVSNES